MKDEEIKQILEYRIDEYNKILAYINSNRAVVLHGDTGVGKTSLAMALLLSRGYKVINLNGSSVIERNSLPRQKNDIEGNKIALLVDEMDRSLSENYEVILSNCMIPVRKKDKKEVNYYKTILPVIFTCNILKNFKFKDNQCKKIEIKPLETIQIEEILNKKNHDFSMEEVHYISEKSSGDIRSVMNCLHGGEIMKTVKHSSSDLVKIILDSYPEKTYEFLEQQKVGAYGGYGFQWVISVLARNVRSREDAELLEFASMNMYSIDKRFIWMLLSCLSKRKLKYIKYPKKKVN